MNPTLAQQVVDDALGDDFQAARSEYLAEWREDVAAFIPREVVEGLVIPGRLELLPDPGARYVAFADLSGGRVDDAALAISHKEGRAVVLDVLRRFKAPHNPNHVVALMAEDVRKFGVKRVIGDNYAAEFSARAFAAVGVKYTAAEKNRSALYLELLPRLCSGEIELLDNPALVDQIAGLERRTRTGGHDDLANAVGGAAEAATSKSTRVLGALF